MTAHKHAHLMAQYAHDAAETEVMRVKEYIGYEPETGRLFWKKKRGNKHTGQTAGSVDTHGHVRIELFGKTIGAHRAAWIVATGHNPLGVVDHINGDPQDNRFCNLRDVPQKVNVQNTNKFKGYRLHSCGKFEARIKLDGVTTSLGLFKTPEDARDAYVSAKRKLHVGCTL